MGYSVAATERFPPVEASAGAARRFVRSCLAQGLPTATVETVMLLTGELVANAVVHGGPYAVDEELVVRVRVSARVTRVEVTDRGRGMPRKGDGSVDASGGRGLLLVSALARTWGVSPNSFGKIVWFEVDL